MCACATVKDLVDLYFLLKHNRISVLEESMAGMEKRRSGSGTASARLSGSYHLITLRISTGI